MIGIVRRMAINRPRDRSHLISVRRAECDIQSGVDAQRHVIHMLCLWIIHLAVVRAWWGSRGCPRGIRNDCVPVDPPPATRLPQQLIDGRPVNSDVRPKDWVAAAAGLVMTSRWVCQARYVYMAATCRQTLGLWSSLVWPCRPPPCMDEIIT